MRRDWTEARTKVETEGRCRLSHTGECLGPLAAAHVVGRQADDSRVVHADDVIPLCTHHHGLYDARRVSILECLTYEEQARAVAKLGIIRAAKRLTGNRDIWRDT
jgi:hypothetical protein